MRPLRVLLAAIVTACGLVLLSPAPPASACSCVVAGPARHVAGADIVFVGTLTQGPPSESFSSGSVTYGFDVHRVYKGELETRADVTSSGSGASCGLEGMEVGTTYLMFADATRRPDLASASLCGGSGPTSPNLSERMDALLGPGSTPDPPAQVAGATDGVQGSVGSRNWTVGYALLGLSAVLLVAIGWVLSPRGASPSRADATLS
jgi:hypothetical protein